MRSLAVIALALSAAAAGACASTGAVPHPFPVPGDAAARTEPRPSEKPPAGARTPAGLDVYALTGTALSLRGTPYRDGGADPSGFDCSGFTQYVFGHHGLALPRNVKDQFSAGQAVPPDQIAAGDLMFFTTVAPGASHVGISLGGDEFVHAPSSTGVVRVERLSAPYWSQRFLGARRIA